MTNKEIVQKIISNSIWMLDVRDNPDIYVLSKLYLLFTGFVEKDSYSYKAMMNMRKHNIEKIFIFFKKNYITYSDSKPINESEYKGFIVLDYDSLLALNKFIDMEESGNSINFLLANINFRSELHKRDVFLDFEKKYIQQD